MKVQHQLFTLYSIVTSDNGINLVT